MIRTSWRNHISAFGSRRCYQDCQAQMQFASNVSLNWLMSPGNESRAFTEKRWSVNVRPAKRCSQTLTLQPLTAAWLIFVPQGLKLKKSAFCPHSVFVWIWEQTAIISLYSINWLVFITETECVYCTVRSAHTVYLCFVWIWEQTAIISLYSIIWLIFITETECVYCAVCAECLRIQLRLLVASKRRSVMLQEFRRRPLTTEARVPSQHSPRQTCGGLVSLWQVS
jgi:hypothetical protein